MANPSVLEGIVLAKCPGCRTSPIFPKAPYNLRYMNKMNDVCPVCGARYEKETGFYYIAMYLSFAFNVAIFAVSFFILHNYYFDFTIGKKILIILSLLILVSPLNFRYSRVLCIYWFSGVKYRGKSGS